MTDGEKDTVVGIWSWLDARMLDCIAVWIGAIPPTGAQRAAASGLISIHSQRQHAPSEGRAGGIGKVGLVGGEAGLRSNSAGVQVANSQLARIRAAGAVAQRHVLLARLPQSDGGPNVCGMHRCWHLDQHASQMSPLPDEETYRTRGIVVEIGWISVGVDG